VLTNQTFKTEKFSDLKNTMVVKTRRNVQSLEIQIVVDPLTFWNQNQ